MRKRRWIVAGGLALLALFAAFFLEGGRPVPELPSDPDEVVVYSLDPERRDEVDEKGNVIVQPGERFHRRIVLGKVTAKTAEQKAAVIATITHAIRNGPRQAARCFIPRHGMQIIKSGEVVELVICFECSRYFIYRNEVQESVGKMLTVSGSQQPVLDKLLTDHGVPLAPKPR